MGDQDIGDLTAQSRLNGSEARPQAPRLITLRETGPLTWRFPSADSARLWPQVVSRLGADRSCIREPTRAGDRQVVVARLIAA
jgi:hypothetical protein